MLPLSFASSFSPEKHYLSVLMKYVKTHRTPSSVEEISDRTGIPNGKSSGKVIPHLRYLQGMNLIETTENGWYQLTPFGKVVFENDRSFSDSITAWCCHAFMCDEDNGAILYREIFNHLAVCHKTTRQEIVRCISQNLLTKVDDSAISPFFGFYTNESAFGDAKIITFAKEEIKMNNSPMQKSFIPMYGAIVCFYLEKYFFNREQISSTEFLKRTNLSNIFGIMEHDFVSLLELLSSEGYVKVSHLVNPPVISRLKKSSDCFEDLYIYAI